MRFTWAGSSRRSCPFAAKPVSSASGIVDHKKYDSRDASAYSSVCAYAAVPSTGDSIRNKNRGEAKIAMIARPMPSSKVCPG